MAEGFIHPRLRNQFTPEQQQQQRQNFIIQHDPTLEAARQDPLNQERQLQAAQSRAQEARAVDAQRRARGSPPLSGITTEPTLNQSGGLRYPPFKGGGGGATSGGSVGMGGTSNPAELLMKFAGLEDERQAAGIPNPTAQGMESMAPPVEGYSGAQNSRQRAIADEVAAAQGVDTAQQFYQAPSVTLPQPDPLKYDMTTARGIDQYNKDWVKWAEATGKITKPGQAVEVASGISGEIAPRQAPTVGGGDSAPIVAREPVRGSGAGRSSAPMPTPQSPRAGRSGGAGVVASNPKGGSKPKPKSDGPKATTPVKKEENNKKPFVPQGPPSPAPKKPAGWKPGAADIAEGRRQQAENKAYADRIASDPNSEEAIAASFAARRAEERAAAQTENQRTQAQARENFNNRKPGGASAATNPQKAKDDLMDALPFVRKAQKVQGMVDSAMASPNMQGWKAKPAARATASAKPSQPDNKGEKLKPTPGEPYVATKGEQLRPSPGKAVKPEKGKKVEPKKKPQTAMRPMNFGGKGRDEQLMQDGAPVPIGRKKKG